jgi:hypothetical protein
MAFRVATLGAVLSAGLCCVVSPAFAQESHAASSCSDAYARGQDERVSGRLFNARRAFSQCAAATCPAAVQHDCERWVREVEADLPSVRIDARSATKRPLRELRVFADDEQVPPSSLSAPIVLEAGPHELRFEARGFETLRLTTALRPSDREVPIEATLREAAGSGPPAPKAVGASRVPVASWLFASAGALALGVSVSFGVASNADYRDLQQRCAPQCDPASTEGMHREAVIADVALVTSVAAFAAAAVIYLVRPATPSPSLGALAARESLVLRF